MASANGTEPLKVDGDRPAVGWVSLLPGNWTTPAERLVLLVLASDAYDRDSAPSRSVLRIWTGLWDDQLSKAIRSLEATNARRPALLQRLDRDGNPMAPGASNPGRYRTVYRLLVNVTPAQPHGQPRAVGGPVDNSGLPPGRARAVDNDSNRTGEPHGGTARGNRTGSPVQLPSLPFPAPHASSHVTTEGNTSADAMPEGVTQ